MTDKERMQELVDMYCDADRRGRIEPGQDNSPIIADVIETLAK